MIYSQWLQYNYLSIASATGMRSRRTRRIVWPRGGGGVQILASGLASMPAKSAPAAPCSAGAELAACGMIAEVEYGNPLDRRVIITHIK
eukprot:6204251-Pleurochrysis_carterae.AAC.2